MAGDYKTPTIEAHGEFTEKRSRFIGYCKPVTSEEEATRFISQIRSKHWDARHNVYAYSLREGNIKRYSDDGEPSGTAGMPVLDVIVKNEVFDVCVVVTRYFGGILLGTGGLVRAYSQAAKLALDAGKVTISMARFPRLSLIIPRDSTAPTTARTSRSHFTSSPKCSLRSQRSSRMPPRAKSRLKQKKRSFFRHFKFFRIK